MSNNEQSATASNSPTHLAYHVREGKDKGFWTRIGVAWQHKDGKGFNIHVDCLPLDGRISVRTVAEKKD